MTGISITTDKKQLKRLKRKLGNLKDKTPVAMRRAINEAARKARTEMDRNTREKYFMKRKFIFGSLHTDLARGGNLRARISSKGKAIPLAEFRTNPAKPNPKRRKPIRIQVKRGGGAKALNKDPKAFVAILKGEKVIAERTSGRRGPLKGLFGPSVPSVMKNDEILSGVEEAARKKLAERLEHHISHLLK